MPYFLRDFGSPDIAHSRGYSAAKLEIGRLEYSFSGADTDSVPRREQRGYAFMDKDLQAPLEIYLSRLEGLTQRGRKLLNMLGNDPSGASTGADIRIWQNECGIVIHELSGGSKAHWLSRAFSEAFLLRSSGGQAVEGASPKEIVRRLLSGLEPAVAPLSQNNEGATIPAWTQPPLPP